MTAARPWTPDREERRRAGPWQWWRLEPGAEVRCPSCDDFVTEMGSAQQVDVRVHPGGKRAKSSHPLGQAIPCTGCGLRLDMRFFHVGAVDGGAAAA